MPFPCSGVLCASHQACQLCLKLFLTQGTWEVRSTLCISNAESVHLGTEPHLYPGRSLSCRSRVWQLECRMREQNGAELNPACNPLAPLGWVTCPKDTKKVSPYHPRDPLGHDVCSPFHSIPLQPQGAIPGLQAPSLLLWASEAEERRGQEH